MRIDRRSLFKLLPASLLNVSAGRWTASFGAKRVRAREVGIRIGRMPPGKWNAITDVPGVLVGHSTIIRGSGALKVGQGPVRTGVTAIWPHQNIYEEFLPFGYQTLNGNGEVSGLQQAETTGILASPIYLTNTSSVGMVYDAALNRMPAATSAFVPVVGETWDAFLNDVEGRHVTAEHVNEALASAKSGPVAEGNVGGGTGMISYQFKGGIGTASRRLPTPFERYTLGVLVQANHGWRQHLRIDGVPVGEEISDLQPEPEEASYFNSILIVIATDAPLMDYQLDRIAKRGGLGLAKTGSISSNSSGDFILAFSTSNRISGKTYSADSSAYKLQSIEQFEIQPFFEAASEATEEAIINALFMAEDMEGRDGHKVFALPIERVLKIMQRHRRLFPGEERVAKAASASLRLGDS